MKLLLGKQELALQNLTKNYSMEYLTTEIELVSPTFKSWTVYNIIEYLTLGLLSSLWNIHNSTTAYFFDPPCTDGPVFVVEPRDQSADVGNQSATLSCLVDSRPPASMAWTLASGESMRVLSHAETLAISPVSDGDFTSYRCTASVPGFEPISRVVRLRRNGQSVFRATSSTVNVTHHHHHHRRHF